MVELNRLTLQVQLKVEYNTYITIGFCPCVYVCVCFPNSHIIAADKENSKKISMDLSAVPETTPSLGLGHGHDKVDLVHRSSVKRRPMSQISRESMLLTEDQQV